MKFIVQFCLLFGLGVFTMAAMSASPAEAQAVPECLDTDNGGNANATAQWWGRRSAEEKKYISELPCEERFIPMVCIFLFEPDLKGCTNKRVAEYRADKSCSAKGHELLSEAHAACKDDFKKTFKPPFA